MLLPQAPSPVSGTAIIDLIPPQDHPSPGVQTVRADGYLLHIATGKTAINLTPPLSLASPLSTNQWIHYKGVLQTDGAVDVSEATVWANQVNKTEDHIRTKTEYDPAAVDPNAHQSTLSKTFQGIDVRKMPPFHDDAMLARVQRIGQSLIPAYQLALPESDPTRIHFRFQVIDSTHWRDGVDLPNGIIVIPHQVVDRLQNDSQLAAVLASDITETLEKDSLRSLPASHKMSAAQVAGSTAGIFVPGLGLATMAANYKVGKHLDALRYQQNARVSLCLLHDAGYDLAQAPLAWWLLAPKHPQPLDQTPLPERADDVYRALGAIWQDPLATLATSAVTTQPATSSVP